MILNFDLANGIILLTTCLMLLAGFAGVTVQAEDAEFIWHDLQSLKLEGQGWTDTEAPYDRLPVRANGKVTEAVWNLSHHSAGMCVRFQTDAPRIQARWKLRNASLGMPHMPASGVSGLDLYVKMKNGAWRKPSEYTPATGAMMESLLHRIPVLQACVRFLQGDGAVGAALVNAQPDMIFVTGSVATGQAVLKAAAEHITPVVCELGGKDPMLVLDDADVRAAARWGMWGAFSNSGQTCMSPERVYVVESVFEAFLQACHEEVQQIRVGYSEEIDSLYHFGSMTSLRQVHIVERQLADALQKGAMLAYGGTRQGMFLQPTILTGVDDSMLLAREETFGPLLPIIRVKDEAEAIHQANQSAFGLSAVVFSEDPVKARRVAEALHVGSVNINDTMSHYGLPRLPFGGVRMSGFGRINGRDGLRTFTIPTSMVTGKPRSYDIATLIREPGRYRQAKAAMLATIGPSLRH